MGKYNDLYFAVYTHRMVTEDKHTFSAEYIVLKNQYGQIVRFTEFEFFAQPYTGRKHKLYDYSQQHYVKYVCMALSYMVHTYPVTRITEISPQMVFAFLSYYASTPKTNGQLRSAQSVNRCINSVSRFFANVYLVSNQFDPEDLMIPQYFKKHARSERQEMRYAPIFTYKAQTGSVTPIFRDIPIGAMDVILAKARIWAPEIYFLIIVQITTGLRPSEALNIRQNGSATGNSIKLITINNAVTDIQINIKDEFQMREDGIRVGGIKKHRVHSIYPSYIPLFIQGYQYHLTRLSMWKCDQTFLPMFPNSHGNAMTYSSYYQKFNTLLKTRVLPALQLSDDPDVRVFALRLAEENLGPHALRHFYTVSLVLNGLDASQIQNLRGDKDPSSALTYIAGKGEILKKALAANTEVTGGLMTIGGEILGNKDT